MRHVLVALLVLAGLPAAAQTVTFRSGNHPDFARLVLDIPAGTAWDLGRTGGDYVLDLGPGQGLTFDPEGIFDRIPRDRIAGVDIASEPGRVVLRLACSCHASAFLFQPDKLVIDVVDGPPPADSPWEDPVAPAVAALPPVLPLVSGLPPSDLLFEVPSGLRPEGHDRLRDDLAADMARALAAGLLDAPEGWTAGADEPALPAVPGQMGETAQSALPPAAPAGPVRPGVNFITADRLQRTVPGARDIGRNGQPCIPESEFDFAAWGQTGDFASDVGRLRSEIVDAAGALDGPSLTALARAYLHFGFGAEARRTLDLIGEDSTAIRHLAMLADLVDGKDVVPGAFADQAGCLTAATLWSALAEGSLAGRTAAERTAIETAFRVLPPGPQQAVGPRLATLFLAAGDARTARLMMERMPTGGVLTEEALSVESDILRSASSAAAARDTLIAAIRDGSRASAGTMIRLVDATLAAGLPPDPWMVDTLAALRFEYRGTASEGPLAATEIRALTAAGRFAEAAGLLGEAGLPVTEAEREILAADFATGLAARGSDGEFLDLTFAGSLTVPAGVPANAVAGRLIDLGFPDVALGLLDAPGEGATMGERRRLRAAALRALGQEAEATLVLAGMPDAQDQPRDPARAWRSGDWDAMTDGGDPLLAEAAAAVLEETPAPPDDETLAGRAALIGASAETRKLAEALLDRFPSPGGAEPVPVSAN